MSAEFGGYHDGPWHAYVFGCFVRVDDHVDADGAFPFSYPDESLFVGFFDD